MSGEDDDGGRVVYEYGEPKKEPVTVARCSTCGGNVIVSRARMPQPKSMLVVSCARHKGGGWSWCRTRGDFTIHLGPAA